MNDFHTHNYPTAIAIFGGTGDLAQTKLLPALFHLYIQKALPDKFVVVGLSRKELSDTDYQTYVKNTIVGDYNQSSKEIINSFCGHFRYISGSFDDSTSYEKIKGVLIAFDESMGMCANKLFYLAVPPQYYDVIFENLYTSNVMSLCDGSWSRILVEKPFGRDLKTAVVLEEKLSALFAEEQIYRIDHYLAKDAIENIMSLRFLNSVVADSWHSKAIESIHIRLFEIKDVSNRGYFYDALGTLRDVGQNHILQILALLTMNKANFADATDVRVARAAAIEMLSHHTISQLVRGQYVGYKETVGVSTDSETETYFKITFDGASPVWRGTEFILEAGKALDSQINEAVITFRPLSMCICGAEIGPHEHRNVLTIQFGPKQIIRLSMWMKQPGFGFTLQKEELILVSTPVVDTYSPEAYERVFFDCIAGDQTRFVSGKEVAAAWQFITPILEQFATLPMFEYEKGSIGPTNIYNN